MDASRRAATPVPRTPRTRRGMPENHLPEWDLDPASFTKSQKEAARPIILDKDSSWSKEREEVVVEDVPSPFPSGAFQLIVELASSNSRAPFRAIQFLSVCVGVVLYFVAVWSLWSSEVGIGCRERAVSLATDSSQTLSCNGDVKSYENNTRPFFVSCPLDSQSFSTFAPASFGTQSLAKAFSVHALAAIQDVSMYQCVPTHGKGTSSFSLKWSDKHHDLPFFVRPDVYKAMLNACGEHFVDNPPFPFNMVTSYKHAASNTTLALGMIDISEKVKELKSSSQAPVVEGVTSETHQHFRSGQGTHVMLNDAGMEFEAIPMDPATAGSFVDALKKQEYPMHHDAAGLRDSSTTLATCDPSKAPMPGCLKISYGQSKARKITMLAGLRSMEVSGLWKKRVFEPEPWEAPPSTLCQDREQNSVSFLLEGEVSFNEFKAKALKDKFESAMDKFHIRHLAIVTFAVGLIFAGAGIAVVAWRHIFMPLAHGASLVIMMPALTRCFLNAADHRLMNYSIVLLGSLIQVLIIRIFQVAWKVGGAYDEKDKSS